MDARTTTETPAPWTLRGQGIMLFYRFSKDFVKGDGVTDPKMAEAFRGGLGSVMLVDYHSSPVGPYREVLYMPGVCATAAGKRRHIPKIYVDAQASVDGGRVNWGLPKELAEFTWETEGRETRVTVRKEGEVFLEVTLQRGRLAFPVTTAMVPILLYQEREGQVFLTNPRGRGRGNFTRIRGLRVNAERFPDFGQAQWLTGVHVQDFTMEFPEAAVSRL